MAGTATKEKTAENGASESDKLLKLAEQDDRDEGRLGEDPPESETKPVPEDEDPPADKGSEDPAEDTLPPKEESKKEEKLVPESKIQERFDQLTAQIYELRRQNEDLRSKLAPEAKKTEYSEDDLIGILQDPEKAQYHLAATKELQKLYAEKAVDRRMAERDQRVQEESLVEQHRTVWENLQTRLPDLKDQSSELYRLANEEYQKIPQAKRSRFPEEMIHAVNTARLKLLDKERTATKKEAARSEGAKKKGPVALGSTSKSASREGTNVDTLERQAAQSGDEMDWVNVLRGMKKKGAPKDEE